MAPLHLLYTCGRWLATHMSKIPQWPADVEANGCSQLPLDSFALNCLEL
jgi:hypothetical protein